MSYRLTSFDGLDLPLGDGVDSLDVLSQSGLAGVGFSQPYDQFGVQAPFLPVVLTKSAIISASAAAAWRDTHLALRGKTGQKGRLWRTWYNGDAEFCEARLLEVRASQEAGQINWTDIAVSFEVADPRWRNDLPTVITATMSSNRSFSAANGGNTPVLDAIITIVPQSGARLSSMGIVGAGHDLTLGLSSGSGSVRIDSGDWTVMQGGTGAWGNLQWGGNHRHEQLINLAPGANTLTLALDYSSGSQSSVEIRYYPQWL